MSHLRQAYDIRMLLSKCRDRQCILIRYRVCGVIYSRLGMSYMYVLYVGYRNVCLHQHYILIHAYTLIYLRTNMKHSLLINIIYL